MVRVLWASSALSLRPGPRPLLGLGSGGRAQRVVRDAQTLQVTVLELPGSSMRMTKWGVTFLQDQHQSTSLNNGPGSGTGREWWSVRFEMWGKVLGWLLSQVCTGPMETILLGTLPLSLSREL